MTHTGTSVPAPARVFARPDRSAKKSLILPGACILACCCVAEMVPGQDLHEPDNS